MADSDAYAHDQQPKTEIFLELVIMPTVGEQNQVAIMYFRYSDIFQRPDVSERMQYLQTEIRARYPNLNVTSSEALDELRRVLREWHPNLGSSARFTIQIPGQLDLASATEAGQASAAGLQAQLDAAQLKKWLAEQQLVMVQTSQQEELARQKAQLTLEIERLQRILENTESDLKAARIDARGAEGRLEVLRQELARASQYAEPADPQRLGELSALDQRYRALLEQFEALKARQGGSSAAPWSANTQQALVDAQSQQGASQQSGAPRPDWNTNEEESGPYGPPVEGLNS